MRKWLAALALVPAVAWGQGDCRSADARQSFVGMAQEVRDAVGRGVPEDALLRWAGEIESPGIRAAAYKAVEAYTFGYQQPSVSRVVAVMQYECKKQYSR